MADSVAGRFVRVLLKFTASKVTSSQILMHVSQMEPPLEAGTPTELAKLDGVEIEPSRRPARANSSVHPAYQLLLRALVPATGLFATYRIRKRMLHYLGCPGPFAAHSKSDCIRLLLLLSECDVLSPEIGALIERGITDNVWKMPRAESIEPVSAKRLHQREFGVIARFAVCVGRPTSDQTAW